MKTSGYHARTKQAHPTIAATPPGVLAYANESAANPKRMTDPNGMAAIIFTA